MTREEKAQIIEGLSQKFSDNAHFYITDASGFTVEQINAFRRMCFKSGVEYNVYKNSLIQKALERQEGVDYSPLFKVLSGFSFLISSIIVFKVAKPPRFLNTALSFSQKNSGRLFYPG